MKKNKGYHVLVVLGVLILLSLACETHTSPNSLRIMKINDNQPLEVDIADWAVIPDPEDPEDSMSVYFVKDWIIPIEVSYVETGLGLPTYPTTYTARITDYRVSFRHQTIPSWIFSTVSSGTNMVIPADAGGRTTVSAHIKVIPGDWIQTHFQELLASSTPNTVSCGVLKATLILSGYEELTREPVVDTAFFTIDIGDYYDDPFRFGQ
ncbi:MAG: hypothetical protein KGZ86_06515 [Candidatus Latescibacteria bacterium]|nr:hypothetical protein [Candidatus Latescibacterota bacterium]